MSIGRPVYLAQDKAWHHRASPLARSALLAYAVLVLSAGLAPWSGWRDLGVAPLAFLSAPVPRFITPFDLLVNVLGYLPLGALIVLALHPRVRGLAAVLLATAGGAVLAGSIEALQTFLPGRVPSNIDLGVNTLGALAGGVLAAPLAAPLIDRGRLQQLRARWFARDASGLLVLLALWPAAQVTTTPMLFGNGRLLPLDALAEQAGWSAPLAWLNGFGTAEFMLAEALVVAAATLAAGLALAALSQPFAPRLRLLAAFFALVLGVKTFAYAWLFGPAKALAWVTLGAAGGLLLGLLALAVAAHGRRRALLAGALAATVLWLVLVNVVPDNPYHADLIARYRVGRLRHFTAMADWLAAAWPLLLLGGLALLAARRRARRDGGGPPGSAALPTRP
jgi:VanZ family protein